MAVTVRLHPLGRLLAIAVLVGLPAQARASTTPVTTWTDQADALGSGNANWHTLAIMHRAMHDAINASEPAYARWQPRGVNEPDGQGSLPQAALESAAATVLEQLHPTRRTEMEDLLQQRLAELAPGPARDKGYAVGVAIGSAAVASRRRDGFDEVKLFPAHAEAGRWRPTPPTFRSSGTTNTDPFLLADRQEMTGRPPPAPGSPTYLEDVETTRRLGGMISLARTPAQSEAAIFWAYQSTQRGFVHLAATLIDRQPERFNLHEQARIMSVFTAAMADSAILIWDAKERWSFWRPVDAIRSGAFGVSADPAWTSFIETPPHPEYPSGHASDCYTGAGLIAALLARGEALTYTAQSAAATSDRPAEMWISDMGSLLPPVELLPRPRHFGSVAEAARECADSRIWAGAHFQSANEESRRIAGLIVRHALEVVPPISNLSR